MIRRVQIIARQDMFRPEKYASKKNACPQKYATCAATRWPSSFKG